MRRSILVLPAVAAVLTFSAGAALASSGPTAHADGVVGTVSDENGTAGYYTNSFADIYTQVNGTFKLNIPSLSQFLFGPAQNGGIGIQLCNATTGYVAQLGVVADTPNWEVVLAKGYLTGDPTGTGSPCDGNTFFAEHITGISLTALGTVPAGTTIQAQIKEVGHGLVYTVADSALANFNYFQPSYPGYFNEAGAGVSTNLVILSAPAVNDLVDFSGVTATDVTPVTQGFAFWNAVEVTSGYPGYPPLIMPSPISPSGVVCTTVPGHWKRWTTDHGKHHHKRWIPEKTTCTGGGPSSFSILTGSPIGI